MQSMEIKNLKTGNLIRFGGEHFKRLVKLQETTEVKYFTKRDLAECVSADKKTKTKTQPKIKKLGTNSKRKQKGGDIVNIDTVRKFDQSDTHCAMCREEYDENERIHFQIDECFHELCAKCAGAWFVHQKKDWCPMCRRPEINVGSLKQQIGPVAAMPVSYETVLSAILQNSANVEVGKNNLKKVEAYIEQGGDVDAKDQQNRTLLHWACAQGKTQVVKLLVEKGADVNAKTARGLTPLKQAVYGKHHEIVDFLLNRTPVDVDARGQQNFTLLHWACAEGKTQVVKLLVEKGADVNAKTERGYTPLDLARKRKYHEIVDFLTNRTRGGGKFSENKKRTL